MLTLWNDFGMNDLDRGFGALTELRDEMNRMFRRFESEWADFPLFAAGRSGWPQVHMHDAGEEFVVTADVPGFQPDDLHVSIEQGSLTIRGERADEVPEGYSVHRKERTRGGRQGGGEAEQWRARAPAAQGRGGAAAHDCRKGELTTTGQNARRLP
jgi:HSP20 family protein